jgi:hypothetical protein
VSAPDLPSAWLDQVAADRELSPLAFRLAFAISRELGDGAVVLAARVKRLAEAVGADAAVVEELVKRAHLTAWRKGAFAAVVREAGRPKPRTAKAEPTASVIPFPADRRRAFVRRQAAQMAKMSRDGASAYLREQLMIQGQAMRRKGIDDAAIGATLRTLESAIRSEMFRQILTPPLPGGDSA